MSDLRDFTGKNRKFTGASGIKVSDDGLSSSDRVNEKGRIRFNDATDLMEYYNGTAWKNLSPTHQKKILKIFRFCLSGSQTLVRWPLCPKSPKATWPFIVIGSLRHPLIWRVHGWGLVFA